MAESRAGQTQSGQTRSGRGRRPPRGRAHPAATYDRRFPRWVFGRGSEPDARFSLANERTYLAWIRTALALTAGGVALEALGLPIQPGLLHAAALLSLTLGLVVPVLAWLNWGLVERAMREQLPLPSSRVALPVGLGVSVVGALLVLGVLLR